MKQKTKNIIFSTTAVGLASVLAVGTLLHTSVSVAASSAMMPGIETIVSNTTKEDPLKILEIVDNKNEAEIGYYVSGQEPTLNLFQYDTGKTDKNGEKIYRSFQSVEEALSVLPTYEERKAFVENQTNDGTDTGIKNIRDLCGEDEQSYPLSFSEYQERYFLSGEQSQDSLWKEVDFENGEIRTVDLPGHFEQVNPGEGDYVKEKVKYYPVRSDIASDLSKAKYRENIRGFAYSGEGPASSPYLVDFEPVKNENGTYATTFTADQIKVAYNYQNGQYGYYENIYRELTTSTDFSQMPGEKNTIAEDTLLDENVSAAEAFGSPDAFSDADMFQSGEDFSDEADYTVEPAFLQETEENPMIYRAQMIDQYPNYKYIKLYTLDEVIGKAVENPGDGSLEIKDKMITKEANGVYKYWSVDEFGARSEYLYYVQGRQQVSMENIRNLPEDYYPDSFSPDNSMPEVMPYYYSVSRYQFACSFLSNDGETTIDHAEKNPDAYQFTGWYYALTPQNEDTYLQTDNDPTYYTSDAEYSLKSGVGDYHFVYDESEDTIKVQVDHLYYQGGYSNHDWLKRYVFHLNPGDDEFDSFGIDVTTMTVAEFEQYLAKQEGASVAQANISDETVSAAEDSISDDTFSDEIDSSDEIIEDAFGDGTGEEGITSEVETIVSQSQEELSSEEIISSELTEYYQDENEAEIPDNEAELTEETNIVSEETEDNVSEEGALAEDGMNADMFSDTEEPDVFSTGDEDVFSAGNTEASSESPAISDYDLIYINGTLSESSANTIAASVIPVIINQSKNTQDSGIATAFADFIKDDRDNHYVNRYIYFFTNTFNSDGMSDWLMNLNFSMNFNPLHDVTDDAISQVEGFEEIIEYIRQENQYRKIGTTTDDTSNSGNFTDDVNQQPDIDLLTEDISQARAIEYILNFSHKRIIKTKEKINVLEIMPDAGSTQLEPEVVANWLGSKIIKRVSTCCFHRGYSSDLMLDGSNLTMWHSLWETEITDDNRHVHWIEVELSDESNVNGFTYTPRKDNDKNGVLKEYTVEFWDKNNNYVGETSGTTGITTNNIGDKSKRVISFEKTYDSVKKIKISFISSFGWTSNKENIMASCAELGIVLDDNNRRINIDTMTSSEFVGHIDDICSKYDMIYIGDKVQKRDPLITGAGDMRYVHVGDGIKVEKEKNQLLKLLGQLDNEYCPETDSEGKRIFAPLNTYGADGGGYFRGSGNDITAQQCIELMDFVKSGYPLVLGSELITSDKKVDSSKVDSASYYYLFMETALKYQNVVVRRELENNQKNILFFSDLAKPVIIFDESEGKPPEPVRAKETDNESNGYIDGELKFVFSINNDSEAVPAVTSYDCNLYIDLNFDGNMSDKELQDQYIEIKDETGRVLSQVQYGENDFRYELKADKKYILTRKIPKDYFKLITWKLEVSSNRNSYIHTSEIGYAKQKNYGEKQPLNVLQIVPNRCTWTLETKDNFLNKLVYVEDYQISFETVSVDTVNRYTSEQSMRTLLQNKQMLIIGFADVYQDISNEYGQVDEILRFIKQGKSVIFSHDTTSYVNYDYNNMNKQIAVSDNSQDGYVNVFYDSFLHTTAKSVTWGLSLNTVLRSVVGMDRYGITSQDAINENGITLSSLLKQGKPLSDGEKISFSTLMKVAGDVAYQTGNNKKSFGQTQAYTNNLINQKVLGAQDTLTTSVMKINDGAITQYPFRMGIELSVAQTHGQYYQLAMEQDRDINGQSDGKTDIVVWYCLNNSIYNDSPNDVRNNYYFYSKGNVIYTGAGHKAVNNDDEIELFINAIVAAANVTAVQPEIHFVKSLNPAAESESVRYYMTDQTSWVNDAQNILEKDMDFYINVKDYNMVSADLSQEDLDKQEMTLEFYIESDDEKAITMDGDDVPADVKGKKMVSLNFRIPYLSIYGDGNKVINIGSDGRFHLNTNTAYGFRINDIEQFLRDDSLTKAYKSNCRVYVKVSSTVYLYGSAKTNTSWASIDLKQRQLFDLD